MITKQDLIKPRTVEDLERKYNFAAMRNQPGGKGADGQTPHIGSNGNWWIGDNDTGVKARAEGVSHRWDGTTLIVTSASGTSSADLKGERGVGINVKPSASDCTAIGDAYIDENGNLMIWTGTGFQNGGQIRGEKGEQGIQGEAGADGERGTGILKVTTAPASYTTATGGKNPIKRMSISTIKTQSGVNEVLVGDCISYSYYLYHIYYLDATYAYMDVSQSIRGATGSKGADGTDGVTPVKGTDYFTDADKAEMVAEVLSELDSIPSYWQTALEEGAQAINEKLCTAGVNKSAFLFYSDAHWDYGSQMSPRLLKYLYKHTGMTKTFFGGDIVNNEATDYDTMKYLWEWRNQLKDLPNHHSVVGNHDDGNATNNLFTEQYVYGYLFAAEETSDVVRGGAMYYYIDHAPEKTRYIFLDTAYKGFTSDQQEFLKNTLIGTEEGWHIVVVSHIWYMPDYDQYNVRPIPLTGLSTDATAVCTILDNYNARSGDFADCDAKVEFCIGGHVHRDYVGVTTGGIPIILCETDSQHIRGEFTYTAGTTTESSVNGVIADYNTNKANIVRVGRGNSFVVDLTSGGISDPDTPAYTNVLDTVGYKKGVYLSNGNEGTDANAFTTGYIPIVTNPRSTIYLKNVNMSAALSHGNRIASYKSDKTYIEGTTYGVTNDNGLNVVRDSDGNIVSFQVPGHAGAEYIRLSAWNIDETSIITVDEPID